MLHIVTGQFQSGKTRWLEQLIEKEQENGMVIAGVLTPGIWEQSGGGYNKLGINLRLLPGCDLVHFADKNPHGGWTVDNKAIEQANIHLHKQRQSFNANTVFIIDELGPLEFVRHEGFTEAIDIITTQDALVCKEVYVVIRQSLLECALEVLKPLWADNMDFITADQAGEFITVAETQLPQFLRSTQTLLAQDSARLVLDK